MGDSISTTYKLFEIAKIMPSRIRHIKWKGSCMCNFDSRKLNMACLSVKNTGRHKREFSEQHVFSKHEESRKQKLFTIHFFLGIHLVNLQHIENTVNKILLKRFRLINCILHVLKVDQVYN